MSGILLDSKGDAISAANPLPVKPGTPSTPLSAVIANGQSVSGEIDLGGNSLLAIEMPAAFSGTVLTFQAARGTGGTYSNVYDDVGLEVSVAVAASRMVGIDIAALKLAPFRFIKIRSGTSASPTAEGGERTLYLVTK